MSFKKSFHYIYSCSYIRTFHPITLYEISYIYLAGWECYSVPSCLSFFTLLLVSFFPVSWFASTFMSYIYIYVCMYMILCMHIKSRNHKWEKAYNISFYEIVLIHLIWLFSVASILLIIHCSLWLLYKHTLTRILTYSSVLVHQGWFHCLFYILPAAVQPPVFWLLSPVSKGRCVIYPYRTQ